MATPGLVEQGSYELVGNELHIGNLLDTIHVARLLRSFTGQEWPDMNVVKFQSEDFAKTVYTYLTTEVKSVGDQDISQK